MSSFRIVRRRPHVVDILTPRVYGVEGYRFKWALNATDAFTTFLTATNVGYVDPSLNLAAIGTQPSNDSVRVVFDPTSFSIDDAQNFWLQFAQVRGGVEQAPSASILVIPDWAGTSVAQGSLSTGIRQISVTIGHADLTEAANGVAQAINIGSVLPDQVHILGVTTHLTTAFSGGEATAVKLDVGGTDPLALLNQRDVFTGAPVDSGLPLGNDPHGLLGGQQLVATFTPDAGHSLAGLTAGSVRIDVLYGAN